MEEYSIQRSQRRCHQTDRAFVPGESYYSAVMVRGREMRRIDVAPEAWVGPPEGAIGWWTSRMPEKARGTMKPAPPLVLLSALDSLLEDGAKPELAYLLALLLVRRRILNELHDPLGPESASLPESKAYLRLSHGPSHREFFVPVCEPPLDESDAYQYELTRLLFCEA